MITGEQKFKNLVQSVLGQIHLAIEQGTESECNTVDMYEKRVSNVYNSYTIIHRCGVRLPQMEDGGEIYTLLASDSTEKWKKALDIFRQVRNSWIDGNADHLQIIRKYGLEPRNVIFKHLRKFVRDTAINNRTGQLFQLETGRHVYYGTLVAFPRPGAVTNDKIIISWSKCHAGFDEFDKNAGLEEAIYRGLHTNPNTFYHQVVQEDKFILITSGWNEMFIGQEYTGTVCHINPELQIMIDRVQKYFKYVDPIEVPF